MSANQSLSLYIRGRIEGIITLTTIQYIEDYGHEDNEEIKKKVVENLLKFKMPPEDINFWVNEYFN